MASALSTPHAATAPVGAPEHAAGAGRVEILAPAGDAEMMRAAIRAGADAVYFGIQGFNARARAANFTVDALPALMSELHAAGVKGYVALNTLVFDHELADVERVIRASAAAGVDALIVQDIGLARFAQSVAPQLHLHASTQMTCTDAGSVELARELGAVRVVLARELSIEEIRQINARVDIETEVFVHGALCVSYSGQCLTSEAIGGRSANRGACAQACRLPYDLIVDGAAVDLGDRAYLLSPQDLEASQLVPALAAAGVASLKIEGRLKGPEYVAATTRLYRVARGDVVTAAPAAQPHGARSLEIDDARRDALVTYSRGSGAGFLAGVDHQQLVEARTCDHRGLVAGEVLGVRREARPGRSARAWVSVRVAAPLKRGDGILLEGAAQGAAERGGRIWEIAHAGSDVEVAQAGETAELWLGPDADVSAVKPGRRVFHNDDPQTDKQLLATIEQMPALEPVDLHVSGAPGEPLVVTARAWRGRVARATSEVPLAAAQAHALDLDTLRSKLGKLGGTPFALGTLTAALDGDVALPVSALNHLRRALVDDLLRAGAVVHATTAATAEGALSAAAATLVARASPAGGLFVLCRNEEQASAALAAGADGVYLDFLALTGAGQVLGRLRERGARFVGLAPPRIRKPGEEKIDAFLAAQRPDGLLVRGLGALREAPTFTTPSGAAPVRIADFSLNVANTLSAAEVLARNVNAFTPSFDLNAVELAGLLGGPAGRFAELVVHAPMPLFHTEHCVFAALLSDGKDYRTCGRPCEKHVVSLRDRAGVDLPVEADVGCRNTVFHGVAQSAAASVHVARTAGCRRFRIELVRESAELTKKIVESYRALLDGNVAPQQLVHGLRATGGYGVVRGSLRVIA